MLALMLALALALALVLALQGPVRQVPQHRSIRLVCIARAQHAHTRACRMVARMRHVVCGMSVAAQDRRPVLCVIRHVARRAVEVTERGLGEEAHVPALPDLRLGQDEQNTPSEPSREDASTITSL